MANLRGQESPMDFQWENAHGPVAEDSPWRVHTTRTAAEQVTPSKTRSQAPAFQASPSKPSALAFTTPSKSNLHNFQSRPTPATLHKQIFATPRQYESPSKADYSDFSTPGDPMDTESEAPTPDPHLNHILHRNPRTIARVLQQSPTRVTGRGEIRKSRDDDRISKEHRSLRHRRRRSRRSYDYSDEDDSDDSDFYDRRRSRSRRSHARSRSRSHLLLDEPGPAPRTAAGSDGWRPKDISDWIQIIFNLGVLGSIFFYGCAFIWTIQADVRNRVEAETGSVIQTIAQCQKDYLTNRCSPPIQRVPAMEEICNKWELCMNMDPHKVGWAKIAAVTLAEIFNGFAHTLTYKSMLFFFIVIIGALFVINAAFTLYRSWTIPQSPPYVPVPMPHYGDHWLAQPSGTPGTPWATPGGRQGSRLNLYSHTPKTDSVAKKLEWN